MPDLQIISEIGYTAVRNLPLVVDVDYDQTPFEAGSAWSLILGAKERLTDTDPEAKFQLISGAGLTGVGTVVECILADIATVNLQPKNLYFGIRARHLVSGQTRLVARGRWELLRPAVRLPDPSVPIYSPTPFPGYVGGGPQDSFKTAENADGGLDLLVYNYMAGEYRRLGITGTGPAERLIFSPI